MKAQIFELLFTYRSAESAIIVQQTSKLLNFGSSAVVARRPLNQDHFDFRIILKIEIVFSKQIQCHSLVQICLYHCYQFDLLKFHWKKKTMVLQKSFIAKIKCSLKTIFCYSKGQKISETNLYIVSFFLKH